ncbi:hypothetical protein AB0F81_40290 [Actinoplanes sp. NPDC024001]|uniref:hypothetical protein n=1 Tax=Actinoplanes sp. NPDC024001 TaxID=3154598 RepID=UPI0033DF17FB
MLSLQPPFHVIEGVAVLRDTTPGSYYFMPAMPHLSTVRDEALGIDLPQLQLLKFRDDVDPAGGAFLTFGVDLSFDAERLANVASEIRRLDRLDRDPLLAPVPLENGSVRLMILGQTNAAGGSGGQSRFELKINPPHESKPALYGKNEAIFSVQLDADSATLIEAALLEGTMLPVGVMYLLEFFALRPAFTVRVSADWNRVQKHFEESFGFDAIFASVDIDRVVDELIESRAVLIEVDSFLPEGEDAGSWVGRRDQAINDFKDMVLDSFFEPSIEPVKEEEDGWDKFTHTAERLALLAATGGLGTAKFHYKRQDLTRIDDKKLNLTMNERVTVKRTIYPQANLKSLGTELRSLIDQGRLDRSAVIQEVDLNSAWFRRRQVQAHALVNFDHDQVDSVNLTVAYGGDPQTLRLTGATASGTRQWNSILDGKVMRRDVEYRYRVNFGDVDTTERPGVIESPPLVTRGDEFEISPRAEGLYFVDDIVIGAEALPWDRYPSVGVDVRYTDERHGIRLAETFMLTRAKPEITWRRFRLDAERDGYEVRITYLSADHRDIVVPWQPTDQERLLIRDPRPGKRTVQVIPAVPWGLVAMVLVELWYTDPANRIDERQTLSFLNTETDRLPKVFTANLADPEQRFVGYSAMILLSDNRMITVPPSMTAAASVVIRTDLMGHRIIAVRPGVPDFAAAGIVRLEADLEFSDPAAGLSMRDTFTFLSPRDSALFEYDYSAAERSRYRCAVRTLYGNGTVRERDLGMLDSDRLIVPAA